MEAFQHGQFTVKYAYHMLCNGPRITSRVTTIWKLNLPLRFEVFAWLLHNDKILIAKNLRSRGFNIVDICSLCREEDETIDHLFDTYPVTMSINNLGCADQTMIDATRYNWWSIKRCPNESAR